MFFFTIKGKARLNSLCPGLLLGLILSACATPPHNHSQDSANFGLYPEQPGYFVSTAYGPDGRLWRVATSKQHVYVDYSSDNGKTFNPPQTINKDSQRIRSSVENRPSIAVDAKNRIFVIYPAEGKQPATVFYSASINGGQQFSTPIPVSDKANEANTLQGTIGISPAGKAYVFWHDDRDRQDYQQVGNSIYYTVANEDASLSASRKASDVLCECCRLAVAFDSDGEPVVLGRFVYPGHQRDHGLLKAEGDVWHSWRVTTDAWRIEACPEQGPALSIADNGSYHIAWLTQGDMRKGLFYAYSADHGQHFSNPMPIGNPGKLASRPALFSQGRQIALAWNEFDGDKSQLLTAQSQDGGKSWSANKLIAEAASASDRPNFLSDSQGTLFLSWNAKNEGFKMFKIDWQAQ